MKGWGCEVQQLLLFELLAEVSQLLELELAQVFFQSQLEQVQGELAPLSLEQQLVFFLVHLGIGLWAQEFSEVVFS